MLTEERLKHSLGVARRCQEIAAEMGRNIHFQQEMFTIGLLHDIGYEFSDSEGHAEMGAVLLYQLVNNITDATIAIQNHGKPIPIEKQNLRLQILNQADIEIKHSGERVTATQRLEDIAERHGKDSQSASPG